MLTPGFLFLFRCYSMQMNTSKHYIFLPSDFDIVSTTTKMRCEQVHSFCLSRFFVNSLIGSSTQINIWYLSKFLFVYFKFIWRTDYIDGFGWLKNFWMINGLNGYIFDKLFSLSFHLSLLLKIIIEHLFLINESLANGLCRWKCNERNS